MITKEKLKNIGKYLIAGGIGLALGVFATSIADQKSIEKVSNSCYNLGIAVGYVRGATQTTSKN